MAVAENTHRVSLPLRKRIIITKSGAISSGLAVVTDLVCHAASGAVLKRASNEEKCVHCGVLEETFGLLPVKVFHTSCY